MAHTWMMMGSRWRTIYRMRRERDHDDEMWNGMVKKREGATREQTR